VTCAMRLMSHSNEAGSKEVSNSKANTHGVISGAWETEVILINKGPSYNMYGPKPDD
jgi:hypothetical protein